MRQYCKWFLSLKSLPVWIGVLIIVTALAYWIPMLKCAYNISGTILMVLCSLIIIVVCGVIIAITYNVFKKLRVRLTVFFVIFIYGIILYTIYHNNIDYSLDGGSVLLAAINNTLSIFFPSRGSYDGIYDGRFGSTYIINFHFMHILAYLYTAMLALSFVGMRMTNRIRKYLPHRQRYVFFGASQQTIILAKDIAAEQKTDIGIFVILPLSAKENVELFESLDNIGAIVLYRPLDGSRIDEVTHSSIRKTNRYFFLNEDEDLNIKLAINLIGQLKALSLLCKSYLYVKTESNEADMFFDNIIGNAKNKIEVNIFNQSELTARQFIQSKPLLSFDAPNIAIDKLQGKVQGEFNILLLGFGWSGREVLKQLICNGQFIDSNFKATILDEDYESNHGDYAIINSNCCDKYNLTFNPQDISTVGSIEFYKWLSYNLVKFSRVIVSLGDDRKNIDIATIIAKLRKNLLPEQTSKIIFAHVRDVEKFGYYKSSDSPIDTFGCLREIYSKQVVVNELTDILAMEMNFDWARNIYNSREEAWHNASVFNQNSSRSSAMGIRNTLYVMGLEYVDKIDVEGRKIISDAEFVERIKPIIGTLAENEHLRWNAFHFTHGVDIWDIDSISYEEFCMAELKANRIKSHNRHAALVNYSDLINLDKKLNSFISRWNIEHPDAKPVGNIDNPQNDINFVQNIPRFINALDMVIVEINIK